jgi:hypothetical protein
MDSATQAPAKAARRSARREAFQASLQVWDAIITYAWAVAVVVISIEMVLMGMYDWSTGMRVAVVGITASFTLMIYLVSAIRLKCRPVSKFFVVVLIVIPGIVQFVCCCFFFGSAPAYL